MGHNSQYSLGSQYITIPVTSPVCGFIISQMGFFIWLAVRPRDFVWPGLKVTTAGASAAEAEAADVEVAPEPYFWVIYSCCCWKWSMAGCAEVWIRVKWNKQFQFFDWGKIEIKLGGVDL